MMAMEWGGRVGGILPDAGEQIGRVLCAAANAPVLNRGHVMSHEAPGRDRGGGTGGCSGADHDYHFIGSDLFA